MPRILGPVISGLKNDALSTAQRALALAPRTLRRPVLQGPPPGMAYDPFQEMSAPRPTLGKTVEWIKRFAYQGQGDTSVRKLVETICADVTPGDYASEALACYYWVCQNIRYIRDPLDVEFVKQPSVVLSTKTGDCDDITGLLAAMLMACGNRAALCVAAFGRPALPSHVFAMVMTSAGWVALDPVANRVSLQMSKAMTASKIYPL